MNPRNFLDLDRALARYKHPRQQEALQGERARLEEMHRQQLQQAAQQFQGRLQQRLNVRIGTPEDSDPRAAFMAKLMMQMQRRAGRFDPQGEGYDMRGAMQSSAVPDETGHWPSRDPRTGMILKGAGHPTFDLTRAAEFAEGNEFSQGPGGRIYSGPMGQ